MNNKTESELYNQISEVLLNHKYIAEHLNLAGFKNVVDTMSESRDFSCQRVLSICEPVLNGFAGNAAPKDWLVYIYQYALSKSFPDAVSISLNAELEPACRLYLEVLHIVSSYQMHTVDGTWQSKYALSFLTEEEAAALEDPTEYRKFLTAFRSNYIYELMKLNQDVLGYNTLDHICGVHYLALNIARQLKNFDLPIDLARVSGAAAGHDIGKYGCTGQEIKRVPYLHYYYTDLWFKKQNITYIGHIAVNHSTWDLELENLPLESLILIYADFRVKNRSDKNSRAMHIYSLKDSFDIILQKLDNVDDAKEKRYKRVYAKLKDFEDYMQYIGITLDVEIPDMASSRIAVPKRYYSLMHGQEIIDNLKYLAINHNINLMFQLRDETSLNAILELARSGNDWKELREYLRIFEEYSTYMTQKQKLITIKFLYEKLTHPEGDIRKHCAELMGMLIAMFDEDYRKEVPHNAELEKPDVTSVELLSKYMGLALFPDHKIIPVHRAWIGYSIRIMISSLFTNCRDNQINGYIKVLLNYYKDTSLSLEETRLYLLETAKFIPITKINDVVLSNYTIFILFDYIKKHLDDSSSSLRVCALEVVYDLLSEMDKMHPFAQSVRQYFIDSASIKKIPTENQLRLKISEILELEPPILNKYNQYYLEDYTHINDVFLKNLKTATDWVIKKAQVDLLLDHALRKPASNGFYTAMHFCNLLKVSAVETVRNRAGEALVQIVPHLSMAQRNDVAIELLIALEIEGYQFAEYIPYYLGQVMLYLQPVELNEILDDFTERTKHSDTQLNSLIFRTIGVAITNYPKYREMFAEEDSVYIKRLTKMLSIILSGLVDYNTHVCQMAFSVLGKEVFGSKILDLSYKKQIFQLTAKKILTLLTNNRNEELLFLTHSAGLNSIYRFISDYLFFKGSIDLLNIQKTAFFPGTFDPFSLSHKEIVKAIRDLGFEVYLAVDEFSWSKRTLPNLLRKNIINMSVADELNVYLYPEDFPTNLASPFDLRVLEENFEQSEIYIVVGSDVLLNASSYQAEASEHSVHTFSHIIFERRNSGATAHDEEKFAAALSKIQGKIIKLALEPKYEDISSTQIRSYIDENRDISKLIDPLAQRYIFENSLYQQEPQYKSVVQSMSINIDVIEEIEPDLLSELTERLSSRYSQVEEKLKEFLNKPANRLVVIRDANENGKLLGFSMFHRIHSSLLYEEFKDSHTTQYIRNNSIGKMLLIDGIFAMGHHALENIEQILLTETLAYCLPRDYDVAFFHCLFNEQPIASVVETLELQGFVRVPSENAHNFIYSVQMSTPCTLDLDIETMLKEPFRSNENVHKIIVQTRKKLQKALTMLYPGQLILSFDRDILYETLIKKICAENNVPTKALMPRQLGPAMCVPYGSILNKSIVPNTITKSLHTEKFFTPDVKSYTIGPYPHYLDLEIQIKMLRSFNRPIILVDDSMDKGYRIKVINALLKKEKIEVQKIIVGLLSGRGRELMEIQNREVDCAYSIPKLKEWFNENAFYPFIGGDALWRGTSPERNLLPSINWILPYTSPPMIKGASNEAIYNLSTVALENAIDILTTLENEYQTLKERKLTLQHLGQVLALPRCPDHGKNIKYDFNLSPSHYLKNDLELLNRLELTVKR